MPFLLLWPIAAVVALSFGEFHVGPLALVGVYPSTGGPGTYFVTILFEFAIVFPLHVFGGWSGTSDRLRFPWSRSMSASISSLATSACSQAALGRALHL